MSFFFGGDIALSKNNLKPCLKIWIYLACGLFFTRNVHTPDWLQHQYLLHSSTSMHSSRMRTARLLTVSRGEEVCTRGVCIWGGLRPGGGLGIPPAPVNMPGPGGLVLGGGVGCLVPEGGAWSQGGCLVGGVPGPRGCLVPGGCLVQTLSGRLLLRAVRILLECILVHYPIVYDSTNIKKGPVMTCK